MYTRAHAPGGWFFNSDRPPKYVLRTYVKFFKIFGSVGHWNFQSGVFENFTSNDQIEVEFWIFTVLEDERKTEEP